MGRPIEILTAVEIKAAARKQDKLRKHCDGGGLWFVVGQGSRADRGDKRAGPASWVFRYTLNGKSREMGFGSYPTVPLEGARKRARDARVLIDSGADPMEHRALERAKAANTGKPVPTFKECALAHIEAKGPGWSNAKHADQWRNTLETYAFPVIGDVPVSLVTTGQLVEILEPIWLKKNETAGRVRQRVEAVLDAAKAKGLREGENPGRWRGHLENLLPACNRRVQHHPAVAHQEIGTFVQSLRDQEGIAARALEFVILCACRTNEALGARWAEIDLANAVWAIPADRMKTRKEHQVPLSSRAVTALEEMKKVRINAFVFPGARLHRPLSNMAMLKLLARMDYGNVTVHGFRSSFRDWAADTGVSGEVAEMALAHAVEDRVEGAYRRGNLLEARRPVMERWANYCNEPAGSKVVTMRAVAAS
jgi:integrase